MLDSFKKSQFLLLQTFLLINEAATSIVKSGDKNNKKGLLT